MLDVMHLNVASLCTVLADIQRKLDLNGCFASNEKPLLPGRSSLSAAGFVHVGCVLAYLNATDLRDVIHKLGS